jgi:hypothetical protein
MSNFAPDWRWPAGMAVGASAFLVCGGGAVLPALGANNANDLQQYSAPMPDADKPDF